MNTWGTFIVILICGNLQLFAQVDPKVIIENRVSKALYYESEIDSAGSYTVNDILKYEVTYDDSGNTVLTQRRYTNKNGEHDFRWYHNGYDDQHHKIEDFIIDQNTDFTFSDTLFHHVYDYENGKLIRQTNIPHINGKRYTKTITSYHYVRKGFHFTYKAGKSQSVNGVASYPLTRVEYRKGDNTDTIISYKFTITSKNRIGVNNPSKVSRDTIVESGPDTAIYLTEGVFPSKIAKDVSGNYPNLNLSYNRVEALYKITNGVKVLNEVELFDSMDNMYSKIRFREDKIRMIIEIDYSENGLYIGAKKLYLPNNKTWIRRVEYKFY